MASSYDCSVNVIQFSKLMYILRALSSLSRSTLPKQFLIHRYVVNAPLNSILFLGSYVETHHHLIPEQPLRQGKIAHS